MKYLYTETRFTYNSCVSELVGDLLADKPKETGGNEAVIVVDCIPVVGQDRQEKLKGVLNKIFGRHGHIQNTWYPSDDDGKTKGLAFVSLLCSDRSFVI